MDRFTDINGNTNPTQNVSRSKFNLSRMEPGSLNKATNIMIENFVKKIRR